MSFDDLFSKPAPKKAPKEPKKEPVKEKCPYCGKKYSNVSRHLPNCPENPSKKVKTKSKPKKEIPTPVDEEKLIKELREQFTKTLTPEQEEEFNLTSEEMKKIEEVMKFLGGTEGYQFIYKSITGDKIRGSMPTIIDECIKWLKKHKVYILLKKK